LLPGHTDIGIAYGCRIGHQLTDLRLAVVDRLLVDDLLYTYDAEKSYARAENEWGLPGDVLGSVDCFEEHLLLRGWNFLGDHE